MRSPNKTKRSHHQLATRASGNRSETPCVALGPDVRIWSRSAALYEVSMWCGL
ncbi:hypothetical protein RB213_007107 [Colletotrichum asianum]